MWRHFGCREILNVEKFYKWRNFGCGKICLISWVVSSGMSIQVAVRSFFWWNLRCFVAKSVLLQFTLFCRKTYFVAVYALSVWRQIKAKMLSVEKTWQISCIYVIPGTSFKTSQLIFRQRTRTVGASRAKLKWSTPRQRREKVRSSYKPPWQGFP